MKLVVIVLAALTIGVGPASRPATRPASEDLEKQLADAKSAVEQANDAALGKCRATPEYKAAAADRDGKQKALEAARRDGSPEDRLAASSAFVKADQTVKRMEAAAVAKDSGVAEAEIGEADVKSKIQAAADERREREAEHEREARQEAAAIANDPVHRAIRENRIVKGMTEDQAERAFYRSTGAIGRAIYKDHSETEAGTRIVRWRSLAQDAVLIRAVTIEIRDGKIVSVDDVDNRLGQR